MARGNRPKNHHQVRHKRTVNNAVDTYDAPRLRVELHKAMDDASPAFTERIARTAVLSSREAHRIIDAAKGDDGLSEDDAQKARALVDQYARAAA